MDDSTDRSPHVYGSHSHLRKTDWKNIQQMVTTYVRVAAAAFGGILAIVGVVMAISVYGLFRTIIQTPESLTTYLDGWETALTPAPPESSDTQEEASDPASEEPAEPENRSRQSQNIWLDLMDTLILAVRDGTIAKPFGALLIFLFAWLLVRIPFGILRAGVGLLHATMGKKEA